MPEHKHPIIGVVMGSDSDWSVMRCVADVCNEFLVEYELGVLSAHRTPFDMLNYASHVAERGIKVVVAGAGGAAHLPGMIASVTSLPVIGVPIEGKALGGLDSLLSIVQMPVGVPVATVAINAGRNAGILAVQMIANHDTALRDKLLEFKRDLQRMSHEKNKILQQTRGASSNTLRGF